MRREAGKVSELEKTIDLLEEMDDEQLQAMQVVAKILVFKKPADNAFFRKLTEEEFFVPASWKILRSWRQDWLKNMGW